jgi:environmental stress-induced protein Ves
MKYSILGSVNYKTSKWQGGKTTELFIYPPEADYQKRNFLFRLSTATVETEKSDFTTLDDFFRRLMVLEGKITIKHEDRYSRQLNKFDSDEFEGGWKTSSEGKCIDFNLMTKGEIKGVIKALTLEKNQDITDELREDYDWLFIYIFKGKIRINFSQFSEILSKGNLLSINSLDFFKIQISSKEKSEIVIAGIHL